MNKKFIVNLLLGIIGFILWFKYGFQSLISTMNNDPTIFVISIMVFMVIVLFCTWIYYIGNRMENYYIPSRFLLMIIFFIILLIIIKIKDGGYEFPGFLAGLSMMLFYILSVLVEKRHPHT